MTRFTIMLFVILSLASCDRRIEKLKQIPVEYRGQWIDEFNEFKKVITDNEIYHYEILENGEIDPISKEIVEIYKVKRKDCTDCLSYGIEVILKSDLGETEFLYLNQFHPRSKKYLELIEYISVINPYNDTREYTNNQTWKRD